MGHPALSRSAFGLRPIAREEDGALSVYQCTMLLGRDLGQRGVLQSVFL